MLSLIHIYTYKTIVALSEGIYTEKRSKFIAIALPVRTVEAVSYTHLFHITTNNTIYGTELKEDLDVNVPRCV